MAVEISGLVALQFGGETGAVGTTPVDLSPAGNSAAPTTAPLTVPMPQDGAVRGVSLKLETGVAALKTAKVAATIGGTEGDAEIDLIASQTEAYASFDKDVMPFSKGDELGASLLGGAADSIATQEAAITLFVQLGKSEI